MDITTIITGAGALTGTGLSLYDVKGKKLNEENAKAMVGTSVALTATAIAAQSLNNQTRKQIQEKYASAYVESMSDEELEDALARLNLLVPEESEKDVKTL